MIKSQIKYFFVQFEIFKVKICYNKISENKREFQSDTRNIYDILSFETKGFPVYIELPIRIINWLIPINSLANELKNIYTLLPSFF